VLRPVLTAMALALLATTANAQTDASQCTAILDDTERLACFDAAFQPSTESHTSFVLQSEQTIPSQPSGREYARLIVACEPDGLVVRFAFAGNQLSVTGSNVGVSLQRDLSRATAITLPVGSNNTELVLRGTPQVQAFLQSLVGTNNLTARVTPASSRSLNVRFRVSELPQQAAAVVNACN
jgi:type VI secretion system protein VasI